MAKNTNITRVKKSVMPPVVTHNPILPPKK